jgi:hypothetical protein
MVSRYALVTVNGTAAGLVRCGLTGIVYAI